MITLKDYYMGRDVSCSSELTETVKTNAEKLIQAVNSFLNEIGISEVKVSSGWRPASINSKVAKAATKSLHISGLAIDLVRNDALKTAIMDNIDKLEKYGLWLESTDHTPTWIHLDLGSRSKRPKRIFIP